VRSLVCLGYLLRIGTVALPTFTSSSHRAVTQLSYSTAWPSHIRSVSLRPYRVFTVDLRVPVRVLGPRGFLQSLESSVGVFLYKGSFVLL